MKYIIDLEGTLMNGKKANKDSLLFIAELQRQNLDFIVMTNSISSPKLINKKLGNIGINIGNVREPSGMKIGVGRWAKAKVW